MAVVVIARRPRDAGTRGKREVGLVAGLDLVAQGVSRTPDNRQHPDQREEPCPKRPTTTPNGSRTRTANGRAGSTCVARPDLRGLCLRVPRLQLKHAFTTPTPHIGSPELRLSRFTPEQCGAIRDAQGPLDTARTNSFQSAATDEPVASGPMRIHSCKGDSGHVQVTGIVAKPLLDTEPRCKSLSV